MSSPEFGAFAPEVILDADAIRRLWNYYSPEGKSVKRFGKELRKLDDSDLQNMLRTFLKATEVFKTDGTRIKKTREKHKVYWLRENEVERLWNAYGHTGQDLKPFVKKFIRKGDPEKVVLCFKTVVQSGAIGSERLELLLAARGIPNTAVPNPVKRAKASKPAATPKPAAREPEQNIIEVPDGLNVTKPMLSRLGQVSQSIQDEVIQCYQDGLKAGKADAQARRKAYTLLNKLAPQPKDAASATVDKDLGTTTPSAASISPEAASSAASSAAPSPPETQPAQANGAKKRKREQNIEERPAPQSSSHKKHKKPAQPLSTDGQNDTYELPVSSSASEASAGADVNDEIETQKGKTQAASKATSNKLHKPSDAEDELLRMSLSSTARKGAGSKPASTSKSPRSSPPAAKAATKSLDDLLMESLAQTARHSPKHVNGERKPEAVPAIATTAPASNIVESSEVNPKKTASKASIAKQRVASPISNTSDGVKTQEPSLPASSACSLEDDLLLQTLAMTKRKPLGAPQANGDKDVIASTPAQNASEAEAKPPKKKRKSGGMGAHPPSASSESIIAPRSPSIELGEPVVNLSKPTKTAKKRKRASSATNIPSLQPQSSGHLEVDESEYDKDGNRIEKPPTVKKVKERKTPAKKRKTDDEQTPNATASSKKKTKTPKHAMSEPTFEEEAKKGFRDSMSCRMM